MAFPHLYKCFFMTSSIFESANKCFKNIFFVNSMSLTVGTTISHFFHPSPFTSSSSSSFSAMNQEWLLGESINFNKNKKLSFSGVGKSYDNEAKVLKNHERVNGFDGCSDTPTLYTPSPKPSQTSLLNTALKQTDCCERCAGCDGAITDKFMLHSMGSFWHDDCLKCACCDCRLGEVGSTLYSKAELLLCKRDYLRCALGFLLIFLALFVF